MDSASEKCSVCKDPEIPENSIFVCSICSVSVHKFCYGIETPNEDFKCSPCLSGKLNPVCKLCCKSGSAFKKTVCGGWVHVICALFTSDVSFEDVNRMEPINISSLSQTKRNQTCSFCLKTVGFCCLCSNSKCKNRFHITCAQDKDCLKEIINKDDDSIKFRAYCSDHKPIDSYRRISSVFVNVIVEKKQKNKPTELKKKNTEKTKEKKKDEKNRKNKSDHSNSAWITERVKSKCIQDNSNMNSIINISSDDQLTSENEKQTISNSMWWDPIDLENGYEKKENIVHGHDDSNKENFILEDHLCFKDVKIDKVRKTGSGFKK